MTLAGPRVLQVVGEDFSLFRSLAKTNTDGLPARAVYVQSALAMAFILTGSFESILIFAGFTPRSEFLHGRSRGLPAALASTGAL